MFLVNFVIYLQKNKGMNMKIIVFFLLLITLSSSVLVSQEDGGLQKSSQKPVITSVAYEDIDTKITKTISYFFDQIIKKDIDQGFEQILKSSVIALKKEEVKNLKSQTERSVEIYGDILSFEFVSAEMVSSSYLRLRYLALHSSYPMRWIFTYYKSPDKGWIITNVKSDDLSENFFTD